jgi:AcrR family transcriptional regulator
MSTRESLAQAAVTVLRAQGIAGVSARAIAREAGVNQALVFYHYGTVDDLVDQACRAATDEAVASYRADLAGVGTFADLLAVGRRLHERESAAGNVALMAQIMAAGQSSPALAGTAAYAMEAWVREIAAAVERILEGSPLAEVVDVLGLSRAVSASFIGLELYDGVDPAAAESAFATLDALGAVLGVVDGLGAPARRLVRARLRALKRQ